MATTKSSKKRIRTSAKSEIANKAVKSRARTLRIQFFKAVDSGDKERGAELHKRLCSALDKAAKKGVFKANTVSRQKSRAAKRLAAMS